MKMKITSQNTKIYTKEGKVMIIMDLKINNFFAFKNFHINMSYPKKIVDSYIEGEFLKGRENFRYKKVNILMGGNATGKTSIGLMLMVICNFIKKKESIKLVERIGDKEEEATITIDFVGNKYKMYRVDIRVLPGVIDKDDCRIEVCTRVADISKKDRYETCVDKIQEMPLVFKSDYIEELEKIEPIGWMFTYPSDSSSKIVNCPKTPEFLKILDYTLRALDPAIKKVEKSKEVDNTYIVHMESRDLIIQDGEVIKANVLSSGTKAGIDIAHVVSSIYAGECGFYYCDEKFSYIHSEMEKAFLTIMINGLRDNEQLFFTTHNSDILYLPLPKHTYTFLKKDINDESQPIKCVYASDFLKRNTDSIRNAFDNDLFSILPNIELVYEIAEMKENGFTNEEM